MRPTPHRGRAVRAGGRTLRTSAVCAVAASLLAGCAGMVPGRAVPSAVDSAAGSAVAPSIPPSFVSAAPSGGLPPSAVASANPSSTSSPPPPGPGVGVPGERGGIPVASLEAAIADFARRTATPGMSVTVRYGDGRTWTGCAGYADVALHRPVTATTAFSAASITKTFTSAVVLQLVEEGRLALDAPVVRYLSAPRLDRRITVRMLLDHTSGLNDVFLAPGIDRALRTAPATRWTTARALSYLGKPYFPPGRGWHYSNTNYLILGLLVERITGHPLATEIRSRLLDPLGLAGTWVQDAERPRAPIADGYQVSGPQAKSRATDLADGTGVAPFRSVVTALDGAGAIATTSGDLATWAASLYGGRVLSTATLGEMIADEQRTSGYVPGVLYGLGVQLYTIDSWLTLGHSGRVLGFRSQMRYVPAAGLSIVAMTNQSRTDVLPLVARLLAILLPTAGPPGGLGGRVR